MRKRSRALLAICGILAAIVAGDLAWILSPAQLERWLRAGLRNVFRTPVEIGEISFTLRDGLRIRGLVVRGPEGEAAIAVDEARAGLDWRRLRLGELRFEWPTMDLRCDAAGRLNLLEALNPALLEGPSAFEPPPLTLQVAHAKVSFRDLSSRAPEQVLSLDGIDVEVRLDRDALVVTGAIADPLWKAARFRAEVDRRSGALRANVDVQKLKIAHTEAIRRRLPAPGWSVFDLLRPYGTGDLTVRVAKDPGAPPRIRVEIQVHEGGASVRVFPYSAQDCAGRVEIENEVVEGVGAIHVKLVGLHGAREGGSFGCDGDIWGMPLGHDDIIDLRIWARDLPIDEKLTGALPEGPRRVVERFAPRGRSGSARVHIFGRTKPKGEPDDIHVALDADIREVDARFDGFPVAARLAGAVSVRGTPSKGHARFTIERLEGTAAGGEIVVHGSASPEDVDVHIVAQRVRADEKLADALLPSQRAIVEMLRLRGEVHADIRVTGEPDAAGEMTPTFVARVTAEPGLRAAFDDFPYPLVYRSGEVVITPQGARIEDVRARGDRSPLEVTVTGAVRADDFQGGGLDLEITGRDMPVDPLLAAASEPRAARIYRELGPQGGALRSLAIAARVVRKGAPVDLFVDATLDDVAIRPPRAALPVRGLTGAVHLTPSAVTLEGVRGRIVEAPLRAEGRIALERGGTSTALARIEGLALDDRLRAELPEGAARAFARVRPQGRIDALVRARGGGLDLEPEIEGELREGAFLLDFFPLAATGLSGTLAVQKGVARLGVAGKLGTGKLEAYGWMNLGADEGRGPAPPRSALHAAVRDLPLDARLLDAFPEAKRRTLADLGLAGTLSLDLDAAFDPRLRPGGVLSYAAELAIARGTLDVGLALTELEGKIEAHGSWPVDEAPLPELEGGFRLKRALWKGQEIARASGRYALGARLFEVSELRAEVLGGLARGSFYSFSEAPRVYGANLSLAGGRLERWAQARYSGKRKASGLLEGELTIAGTSGERGERGALAGEGELRIRDAHLWELPLFAGILNAISFELPGKPVFDDAYVGLRLEDRKLFIEEAVLSSAALSLFGKGTLADGIADLTFVPELGRPWIGNIPVLGPAWGFLKGNILGEVEVKGPLDDPTITAVPVKMLLDPARWIFTPRRRGGARSGE